mmetsp:Transcript_36838/g.42851  ORF Transcript_36838/g.42851 Transcript_36838/m.42851 type:complete len:369 (-) Transcript_36838:462-1568(-)
MCTSDTTSKTRTKQPAKRSSTMSRSSSTLYDAALHGKFSKVLVRVKTHPHEARIKNSFGYTPLHWLAASQWRRTVESTKSAQNQHYDALVAVYIAYPEAIGIENDMGRTPLHYAVEYGASEEVVSFLQNPTTPFLEEEQCENINKNDEPKHCNSLNRKKNVDPAKDMKAHNNVEDLDKALTMEHDLGKLVRRIDVKLSLMESATLEENSLVEKERLARLQKINHLEKTCSYLDREFVKGRVSVGDEKNGAVLHSMVKSLSDILDEIRRDQVEADIDRRRLRNQLESQIQGLQFDMKRVVNFQFRSLQREDEERKERTKTMRLDVERALQDKLLRLKRRLSGLSESTFSTTSLGASDECGSSIEALSIL